MAMYSSSAKTSAIKTFRFDCLKTGAPFTVMIIPVIGLRVLLHPVQSESTCAIRERFVNERNYAALFTRIRDEMDHSFGHTQVPMCRIIKLPGQH